jgi:hypothetical protein
VRPRLVHPISVSLVQIDAEETVQDDDFREPVADPVWRAPVSLRGQISYARADRLQMGATGDLGGADGHVVFLADELAMAGITLHKGDRFTAVTTRRSGADVVRAIDYEIIEVRPQGHYPDYQGLTFAFFRDRPLG